MKPAEDQPETRGRWLLCSISKYLKVEGLSSLCPISWRGCELRVFPGGLVRKAEPLLLLLGLCSGKRPQALFSLRSNSSEMKCVWVAVSLQMHGFLPELCQRGNRFSCLILKRIYFKCPNAKSVITPVPSDFALLLFLSLLSWVLMDVFSCLHCSPWSYPCTALLQIESRGCHLPASHPAGLTVCLGLLGALRRASGAWHRASSSLAQDKHVLSLLTLLEPAQNGHLEVFYVMPLSLPEAALHL